jgi:hypothetical protein
LNSKFETAFFSGRARNEFGMTIIRNSGVPIDPAGFPRFAMSDIFIGVRDGFEPATLISGVKSY